MEEQRSPGRLRAVIFVHDGEGSTIRAAECGSYCQRRGYTVGAAVIGEPDGPKWEEVRAALESGEYDVLVVRDRGDLDPDRVPRLEVVAEELHHEITPPKQRERTRRLRPPGAGR